MNTNDAEKLEQQRQRRKRVNRMKTGIVLTIALWMIVSLLAIMILTVQVIKLNSKVYILEIQQTSMEKSSSEVEEASEDIAVEEEVVDPYANVITGINSTDNIAKEGDKHRVYLTFDCNPGQNTETILDVLQKYGLKATFFVMGNESEDAARICKRIVDEGHTIGMNSFLNQYSTIYSSVDAFEEDYDRICDFVYDKTGIKCKYYRFPGGSSNRISNLNMVEFVRVLNQKGTKYFDWNVSAGDTGADYSVDDIVSNVSNGIMQYKSSIVLLHDDESKMVTADAIEPLIIKLQKMHTEILPIDENTYVVQYIKASSVE